jgi:hypothetical protein
MELFRNRSTSPKCDYINKDWIGLDWTGCYEPEDVLYRKEFLSFQAQACFLNNLLINFL